MDGGDFSIGMSISKYTTNKSDMVKVAYRPKEPSRGKNLLWVTIVLILFSGLQYCQRTWRESSANLRGQTPESLTVHREMIQGVDVLFAEPTSKIKGILFVAHGCSHSNTDWFLDCDGCIGLPEERAIVEIGLKHGLVVVAISSSNRRHKCWDLAKDVQPVGKVLQELSQRYKSSNIIAFGASSGGAFVSGIATPLQETFRLQIQGYLSQIAAVGKDDAASCQVYITMDRDIRTDGNAQFLIAQAPSHGKKMKTRHIRVPPLAISNHFFASRIPEISLDQSKRMVEAFQNAGLLDSDGYLVDDPRRSPWREALNSIVDQEVDSLVADQSPISEVLNAAYGMHEMTRDGVKEALDFCLGSS